MKKWHQSKTVWFNVVFGLAAAVSAVLESGNLSAEQASVLAAVGALANLVLRFLTDAPLDVRRNRRKR